jgi:hypothetical protein
MKDSPLQFNDSPQLPIQVNDHPLFWWAGWFVLALPLLAAWFDSQAGKWVMTPASAVLGLAGLYLLIAYGRTQVDATYVRRSSYLGTYQMWWWEINRVEVYGTQKIVFRGINKSLVIPGPVVMSATNRAQLLAYIQSQIQSRSIATGTASFWAMSRNTLLRWR